MPETKRCTRCERLQPIAAFNTRHRRPGQYHSACRACQGIADRAKQFGLTYDALKAILDTHPGTCDICGHPPEWKRGRLSIDHDHATGRFRGLLCQYCNMVLGYAFDTPEILRRAAAYLERAELS